MAPSGLCPRVRGARMATVSRRASPAAREGGVPYSRISGPSGTMPVGLMRRWLS
jgi:hypothetical protein